MEKRVNVKEQLNTYPKSKSKSNVLKQFYPNSSLVRRARLIPKRRRRHFIHQILIIGLKDRSRATDYERGCVGTSSAQMIPSVNFAYPPMGSNSRQFPPVLFYPDFTKCTIQRKEGLEAFPVVLTNEKGDRTFAYCFKFLSKNWVLEEDDEHSNKSTLESVENCKYSVLVFVSVFSQENLFYQLATDFICTIQKDSTKIYTMGKDLLALTLTTSEEAYQNSKYVIPNDDRGRKYSTGVSESIGRKEDNCDWLKCDRCFQSSASLYSQIELCYNPTPYICGILRYNLSRVKELLCPYGESQDEVTIVDVERGVVLPCLADMNTGSTFKDKEFNTRVLLNYATVIGFPKGVVGDLLSALKSCLSTKSSAKADYKIEKNVMIFYAKIFGHYKRFGQDIMTARNRKRFAAAHPCADTRLFLKWFVENGILQSFIFSQRSVSNGKNLESRFEDILKKYSPPVDKKGKRRKAKSYLWRIFTL
uniref:Uncharacterized protein n=1 Tax=Ditylenchus dipsaci TaxID=166011 RepID=A0A915DXK3_9BILA